MRAIVTAEMPDTAIGRLEELGFETRQCGWGVTRRALEGDELVSAISTADVLICELERIDAAILERCPSLKIVAACRGNATNIDLEAARNRGLWILNTPGRNAESVADFTIGLILALQRQIVAGHEHLRTSGWNVGEDLPYFHFRGHELAYTTVGILGYGAVGSSVARRLTEGFGATVLVHDPYVTRFSETVRSVGHDELFDLASIVSLHAAVDPGDSPAVGERELSLLGRQGLVVNTARAALVDEVALITALTNGKLGGAALDVFWTEPIPRDHPLLRLSNVITTPHIAGAADDVREHHSDIVIRDIEALLRNETPRYAIVRGSLPIVGSSNSRAAAAHSASSASGDKTDGGLAH